MWLLFVFFFKQKTAYEMRISDWSSDVCSSDLLPAPPRDMTEADVAHLRGEADAMALRLRHHDEGLHRKNAPASPEARAVYAEMEQVRVEALGAPEMKGVAGNMQEALGESCRRAGY